MSELLQGPKGIQAVWPNREDEYSAEILRLRAENEKLQWELGKALDTLVVHDAVCAENEKLRAALKPFADYVNKPEPQTVYELGKVNAVMVDYDIFCKLCRAAAAALKETGNE